MKSEILAALNAKIAILMGSDLMLFREHVNVEG
jgi:hypothetical protein